MAHTNPGRKHCIDQISRHLGSLAYDAKISSTGNRNDTAIISESIFCGLLNRLKGWHLRNANSPGHPNFPAVDLVDEAAQVAVQITLENTVSKVDDMLDKFKKHKLNRTFKHLILLVLTMDKPTAAMKGRDDGCFYGENDIWNIPRIMREIEQIEDVTCLKEIEEYLSQEIGKLSAERHGNHVPQDASEAPRKSPFRMKHVLICALLAALLAFGGWLYSHYMHQTELRNTLMKNSFSDAVEEQYEYAFNTQAKRYEVGTITFLDSMELVPEHAADASQLQNGKVRAWATPDGSLYDLYIAADGDVNAPDDSGYLFCGMINLTKIDFRGAFSTKNVESMHSMFRDCRSLKNLDIRFFDTDQVTNIADMFRQCSQLTELDLRGLDTSRVTNMERLFYLCDSLTSVDLSSFDTSSATTLYAMFCDCPSLKTLDLSSFDTKNVTKTGYMFARCRSLEALELSNFDTSNVMDMSYMFQCCDSLTQLDLSGFDTSKVTDMSQMFRDLINLSELDLSHFDTSAVTNMYCMFYNCKNLQSLDLSSFNTEHVTNMSFMFGNCENLSSLNLSSFDTGNVTDMSHMFSICTGLSALDLSSFDTGNVTNMSKMFFCCSGLSALDISSFDTEKVTNMSGMFQSCSNLENLALDHFVTDGVVDVSYMFSDCPRLSNLDISGWDLSSVTEHAEFMDSSRIVNGQPWKELFSAGT